MPDGAGPSIIPADAGPDFPTQKPRRGWRRLLGGLNSKDSDMPTAPDGRPAPLPATSAEREMMERIVGFKKKRVDDVAIPRADIVGVELETGISELLKTFSEANHSRLPVFRGDLDDPVGVIHIKDVIGIVANGGETENGGPVVQSLMRKILYVPPSMPVTELLLRMQASRVHMALVIDEFGGTDGLVTVEDLVELIVGDLRDEHDDDEDYAVHKISDGRWVVDARVPLDELEEQIGTDFKLEDHDADTLGGLVFSLAGRVPLRGEILSHPNGTEVEVIEADPRRIHKVRIRMRPRPALEQPPPEAPEQTAAK